MVPLRALRAVSSLVGRAGEVGWAGSSEAGLERLLLPPEWGQPYALQQCWASGTAPQRGCPQGGQKCGFVSHLSGWEGRSGATGGQDRAAAWLELKAGMHEEGPGAALQPANTAGGEEALGTAELSQGGAAGWDLCCCGPDQQLSAAPCCGMFRVGICQLVQSQVEVGALLNPVLGAVLCAGVAVVRGDTQLGPARAGWGEICRAAGGLQPHSLPPRISLLQSSTSCTRVSAHHF